MAIANAWLKHAEGGREGGKEVHSHDFDNYCEKGTAPTPVRKVIQTELMLSPAIIQPFIATIHQNTERNTRSPLSGDQRDVT
jgi:hypothetical protein